MVSDKELQAQTVNGFLRHLDRAGCENLSYLREQANDYKEDLEQTAKLEPLSASTLSRWDAFRIFNLGDGQKLTWQLEPDEVYDVSDCLIQYVNKIDNVAYGESEVRARTKVDAILIEAVFLEKRFALGVYDHNQNHSLNDPVPATTWPGTPLAAKSDGRLVPAPLMLKPEVELHRIVSYKHERRLLKGKADYTLYYDGTDPYGTNLVIIEAKKSGATDSAEGQLLAYMGMVHEARKEQGKRNIGVYGVASDGQNFRYYRIDNESQYVRSPPLDWDYPQHQKEIVSRLRLIIRAAIVSSPSTTPIKKGQLREAMLTRFDGPVAKGLFDFNIREADWGSSSEDMEVIGDT